MAVAAAATATAADACGIQALNSSNVRGGDNAIAVAAAAANAWGFQALIHFTVRIQVQKSLIFLRVGVKTESSLLKDVVRKGTPGLRKVVIAFGDDILLENGEINRSRLGQIIFSDPAKRQLLNRILAPHISSGIFWEIVKLWVKGCKVIVLDIPLLFETKMDRWMDPIIVVWINPETQLQRLMARDGISEEEARNKINSQTSLDWKKTKADIVIDNSGSIEDTGTQFQKVLKRVTAPLSWKEFSFSREGIALVILLFLLALGWYSNGCDCLRKG